MDWKDIEKRRFVRGDVSFKVFIYSPDKEVISVYCDNISRAGLRLVLDKKIEALSEVDLEIYFEDEPLFCRGKVAWIDEQTGLDGKVSFNTGIELVSIKGGV